MKSEDITNVGISNYLLNKHWEIFNTLDTRRIKSFFHLYYFCAIIFLLTINKIDIHTEFIKLDFSQIMLVTPLIILILLTRYIVLSSHSINLQYKHNRYFESYRLELAKPGEEHKTVGSFKNYEQSELPNCFMFPLQVDAAQKVNRYLRWIPYTIFNIVLILINIAPLVFFFVIVAVLFPEKNYFDLQKYVREFYYLSGTLILLTICYFYFFKSKASRIDLRIKKEKSTKSSSIN